MISWMGGKKLHAKWINPHLPGACTTYVEPFGGAFWIHFMSNVSSENVVYNDINPQLANLFKCVSESPEKLLNETLKYEPQNAELFIELRDDVFKEWNIKTIPNYEVAAKFAYIQTQVFSGNTLKATTKMTDLKGKYRSKYEQFQDKLKNEKYINKMLSITNVENLSFEKIIEKYDSKDTFFYIDPPYFDLEHYYTHCDVDHELLLSMLQNIKGKFALSYYYYDKLSDYFEKDKYKWIYKKVNKQNGNRKQTNSSKGIEVLITNYDLNW